MRAGPSGGSAGARQAVHQLRADDVQARDPHRGSSSRAQDRFRCAVRCPAGRQTRAHNGDQLGLLGGARTVAYGDEVLLVHAGDVDLAAEVRTGRGAIGPSSERVRVRCVATVWGRPLHVDCRFRPTPYDEHLTRATGLSEQARWTAALVRRSSPISMTIYIRECPRAAGAGREQ